jgi:hypothetical protein
VVLDGHLNKYCIIIAQRDGYNKKNRMRCLTELHERGCRYTEMVGVYLKSSVLDQSADSFLKGRKRV